MRRILLIALFVLLSACNDGSRFTPEAWRQADAMERHQFTADLLGRRLLIGKNRHEIDRMLGLGYRQADSSTWKVGADPKTQRLEVLRVDFKDEIAVRAELQRVQ